MTKPATRELAQMAQQAGYQVVDAEQLRPNRWLLQLKDKSGNTYINPCTGKPLLSGQIFNPASARVAGGRPCSDPFLNNIIPPSMISRTSAKIVALYQKYYRPEIPGLLQNDRLPKSNSPAQTPDQAVVKIDHNFSDKSQFSGSGI